MRSQLSGEQKKKESSLRNSYLGYYESEDWEELYDLTKENLITQNEGDETYLSFTTIFFSGIAAYKLGYLNEAINYFNEAEDIKSGDPQLFYNLGITYLKSGNYNLAIENLEKCIKYDPKHIYAYNNLTYIFNISGLYKQTNELCLKCENDNKKAVGIYRNWAYALMKEKYLCEAVK